MRYIEKNEPPQALINWRAKRAEHDQDLDFRDLDNVRLDGVYVNVKEAIKKQRLEDQGYLCAYTQIRIELDTSHVEHLKPQSLSRINDRKKHFIEETVDYENMVLCYPKQESKGGLGYGAPHRGDAELALTPRKKHCETLLRYKLNGEVYSEDSKVSEMIGKVLNLNHQSLVDRRKDCYCRKGLGRGAVKLLSENEALRLAKSILNMDAEKKLSPFCVGISQAAVQHAALMQKRRKKKKMMIHH